MSCEGSVTWQARTDVGENIFHIKYILNISKNIFIARVRKYKYIYFGGAEIKTCFNETQTCFNAPHPTTTCSWAVNGQGILRKSSVFIPKNRSGEPQRHLF